MQAPRSNDPDRQARIELGSADKARGEPNSRIHSALLAVFAAGSAIETGSGTAADRPLAGKSVRWSMGFCDAPYRPRAGHGSRRHPRDARGGRTAELSLPISRFPAD